jgi:hypothetical protein
MKKTREEIQQAILSSLNQKPLSIQDISKEINSNWSTVEEVLGELEREGKVRVLVATEKLKIFVDRDYPVFYGIPIQKKIIDKSLMLMNLIVKEWRDKNKTTPPLTTIHKIAVDIVYDKECGIDLPVVDFHYGKVLPVIFKPVKIDEKQIENYSKIIGCIRKIMLKHSEIAWKERRKQYEDYNMDFYKIKEEIQLSFNKKMEVFNESDKRNLEKSILSFSIKYPIYDRLIYNLFSRFESSSVLLLGAKEKKERFKDHFQSIRSSFEKIWDLTTTYLFFEGIKRFVMSENHSLFDLIRNIQINSKIASVESDLLELESFIGSIKEEDIPEIGQGEIKETMNIFLEGIEEE